VSRKSSQKARDHGLGACFLCYETLAMTATDPVYVYRHLEYIRRLRWPVSHCNCLRKSGKRCVAGKSRRLVGERSKWPAGPFQDWLGMRRSQDQPVD
jgi:hypothetical protein